MELDKAATQGLCANLINLGVKELIIEKILGQIQILWVQRNHSI